MNYEIKHNGYASEEQALEYCKMWVGDRCWCCKFFDQGEQLTCDQLIVDGNVSGGLIYHLDGYCRCHSPHPSVADDGEPTASWPWVDGKDWCGEYQGIGIADAIERLTF